MSKRGRMLMEPASDEMAEGSTNVEIVRAENFARNLFKAMTDRGMSQSDLARALWGETVTSEGKNAARGRDRISVYLKGRTVPTPSTLKKIAEALGVPLEELAPDIVGAAVDRDNPEFSMSVVAGHPDKTFVRVSKLLPLKFAVEIAQVIERAERHSKGLLKEED
ncbi:helix-turn-helix domain-containing protein [Brucella anthropi]|uniref:helix-turn-helix domain-containing protein n=1 Tax=Brucella anthropi TaxID=529 RepID=UPI003987F73F